MLAGKLEQRQAQHFVRQAGCQCGVGLCDEVDSTTGGIVRGEDHREGQGSPTRRAVDEELVGGLAPAVESVVRMGNRLDQNGSLSEVVRDRPEVVEAAGPRERERRLRRGERSAGAGDSDHPEVLRALRECGACEQATCKRDGGNPGERRQGADPPEVVIAATADGCWTRVERRTRRLPGTMESSA